MKVAKTFAYKDTNTPNANFIEINRDLEKAFETYDLLSDKYFTHATPTLFNAGSPRPQMSSCYLIACGDSIDDIADIEGLDAEQAAQLIMKAREPWFQ